ncbi:putative ribonuclease H-like domain-containing protein [Tanacetum coccineum]
MPVSPILTTRVHKDHPLEQIIGDIHSTPQTRRMTKNVTEHVEPKKKVWTLVDLPYGKRAIGTKWVYRNKKDDRGIMVRNKARLVAQGYTQEEGIDYDEFFAPVARIKAIRLFLAYASFMNFIVYQMDVKSAFFMAQLKKRFMLSTSKLLEPDDAQEIPDEFYGGAHFLLRVAVSTPIETNKGLLKDEEAIDVYVHLYRSMIGSLMYLTASRPDIMFTVCACARFQVTPMTSHLHDVKRIFRSLKGHPKLGLWYPRDSPFDLEGFFNSDYAGASLDRKSKTGGCQFLGRRLISWQCKKQTIVANSTNEAEYVVAANCYETVIKEWEDKMERAATTASSLEAEQDSERELVRIKINDGNAFWNEIGVNAGVSKLMLLSLNLLLPVLVYAARHSLTAVRHKLMLPGITSYCWYALTVHPTVYESCIQQFWATTKAKIVNGERQIQALVDKKKVIITEKSVRNDLIAKTTAWNEFSSTMVSAIICLATNQKFNFSKYIFDHMMKNLEGGVKFLMYPRFVQVFLDKQVEGMSKHKGIYVTPSYTKKIFANMKREGTGRITPLFQTMMVQAPEDMGEDSAAPTDSHSTPIITQPSSSKPQKKKSKRKQRKDSGPTEPIPDEATNEEPISTPSCDPPQSGEDRLQLTELMNLCTKLQKQVLDLEEAKTAQAKEIASLKKRVKQLEKRKKSRTSGLKRLRKVGSASRVESSNDVSLGAQEDASKQGRKIADLDADKKETLIDETQERYDEEMLFDIQDDLQGEEVVAEKEVAEKEVSAADPVTTAGEVVTTASATTTVDELTLAQTLIEIKAAKPKAITTSATIITTAIASTRPKAKGIVFHD